MKINFFTWLIVLIALAVTAMSLPTGPSMLVTAIFMLWYLFVTPVDGLGDPWA